MSDFQLGILLGGPVWFAGLAFFSYVMFTGMVRRGKP
jgi:hypothetical protein